MYYCHKKRGTNYDILGEAPFQLSTSIKDGDEVVIYQDRESKKVYVRPKEEFFDPGRFEVIEEKTVVGYIAPILPENMH